jgi:hypothetical protein
VTRVAPVQLDRQVRKAMQVLQALQDRQDRLAAVLLVCKTFL